MSSETYRFKVGNIECMAINDGTFTYAPPAFPPPTTFLFANAPKENLEHVLSQLNLKPDQWKEWISPYICLAVKTEKNLVLVDTGADGLGPKTGKLLQNLKIEGILPKDIDTVILTHGHPDHLGGNTDKDGKPVFPKARFVMWKDEWDFWNSEQAEQKLDEHIREILFTCARKNLQPIQSQVRLIDHETEIVPGISAIPAPGHTPGHMALAVTSGSERLLCTSDAFLHPIHVEYPNWYAAIDFDPQKVVTTRHQLLKLAATQKTQVVAFHFTFPGLGRIIKEGETRRWQPMAKVASK
jgi:glyoxylase-like metal-dependent hydrolase (beta-lactamase superfamily II)